MPMLVQLFFLFCGSVAEVVCTTVAFQHGFSGILVALVSTLYQLCQA